MLSNYFFIPLQFQISSKSSYVSQFCHKLSQFQIIRVTVNFVKCFFSCILSSKFRQYLHSPQFKHQISSPLINLNISDYLLRVVLENVDLFLFKVCIKPRYLLSMLIKLVYLQTIEKTCTPDPSVP